MNQPEMEPCLKLAEAAEIVRVSTRTMAKYARQVGAGRTPGGHWRLTRGDVAKILRLHEGREGAKVLKLPAPRSERSLAIEAHVRASKRRLRERMGS